MNDIAHCYINKFSALLKNLPIKELSPNSYLEAYLEHLIVNNQFFLHIYASVLNELLHKSDKSKEQITLVDYGAGNGLLGLFAKYCGFGKVILSDISPARCQSQKMLSEKISIYPDDIICGDVDSLEEGLAASPDAIIGTDVIEHIYDLDLFFSTLQRLNKTLVIIFTTASNEKNWLKKKWLMRLQKKDEWEGWKKNEYSQAIPPFRETREAIIREALQCPELASVEALVTGTRGLRKVDIICACKIYEQKNILPVQPRHPTNTCDPITGSWTERLLAHNEYRNLYEKYGFSLDIKNGFYNEYQKNLKGFIFQCMNTLIRHAGKAGSFFSPYIMLTGLRK
ncbi:MAG: class I SAM-dependent methyltransferase [Chitinophagaceae bacterium]|nr:class I SAM-dependent methyltransferase [Chitinophagaceae bacterium]